MDKTGIEQLRSEIDRIDGEIVKLLGERCHVAGAIGEWKKERGLAVYDPSREDEVYEKILRFNAGRMPDASLRAVYREIISAARSLERPLTVACLGPEGTFSCQAAAGRFGASAALLAERTIPDVFSAVECGRADYGCVPVENSTDGVVTGTLDRFFESTLKIFGECRMAIHHNLAGFGPIAGIRRIYSHRQALAQCRNFLQDKFHNCEIVETASTAQAALRAAQEGGGAAALCGVSAAELAGLPLLLENVEDSAANITRFLFIGREDREPTGNDKTSLCIGMPDRVGALYDALAPFKDGGVSMTMIESRPGRVSAFEYCFFVDVVGHRRDGKVAAALRAASGICSFVKVLGSYPCSADGVI
ncbi:MAG: prephenate dehydratase [Victivallaceae bacterium]|nr:prephenate dehydratase [Victivallaceae bacterium]